MDGVDTNNQKTQNPSTVYNVHIFRKDLVEIQETEMEELTDNLLEAQLDGNIILDLKASFKNKIRRSYTIKTTDRDGVLKIQDLIEKHSLFKEYKSFCANLSEKPPANRMSTILRPKLRKHVEKGSLIKLLTVGSKKFLEEHKKTDLSEDLNLEVPPKELGNRTSIVYDVSDSYKIWLSQNDFKIKLMGNVLSFKSIIDIEKARNIDPLETITEAMIE